MDDDSCVLRHEIDQRRLRAVLAKMQPTSRPRGALGNVWWNGMSALRHLRRNEASRPDWNKGEAREFNR